MLKRKKTKSYFIAITALFVSLGVLANLLDIVVPPFTFSVVVTINFLAGILISPLVGFLSGGLSDIIGCFLKGYAPNPFILIGSSLWGLIMGLCVKHLKFKLLVKIIIASSICFIVCSLGLNSYGNFIYQASQINFFVYVLSRLPFQLINLVVNVLITYVLAKLLK